VIVLLALFIAALASLLFVGYIFWLINETGHPPVEYVQERITAQPPEACPGEIVILQWDAIRRRPGITVAIIEQWRNLDKSYTVPAPLTGRILDTTTEGQVTLGIRIPPELEPGRWEYQRAPLARQTDRLLVDVIVKPASECTP
jgi:hypothetical protein